MSRYTLRLSDVCEMYYAGREKELNNSSLTELLDNGLTPLENIFEVPTPDEIIEYARPKIFDFDYPLPNNNVDKKKELETKILKHYYTRELGADSWGVFKLRLNERLNLIMPYFNDLYKTIDLMNDNPLINNEITETKNTKNSNTNSGQVSANSTSNAKEVFQNTPSSQIGDVDYATTITTNENSTTDTSENSGTSSGNEDMIRTIRGLSNYSKQDMISRYRENIINVEEAIINELYDLFLLIYS